MAKAKGPAYQVIYRAILKKINKGDYVKETAIPSENELALKYGVSRMTARKSVDMLVAEGYLFRHKGKGTFVTGRRNLVREEISLTARLETLGRRIYSEVKLLEETEKFPEVFGIADPLKSAPSQEPAPVVPRCWRIERIRFVDDAPAIYERIWIPAEFAPELSKETAQKSLAELLSQKAEIGSLELSCEAGSLTKRKAAKALELKKEEGILLVRGIMSFMDGTPCLYSESWQNTKVLPFTLKILK